MTKPAPAATKPPAQIQLQVVVRNPTGTQTRSAIESAVATAVAGLSGFGSPAIVTVVAQQSSGISDLANAPTKIHNGKGK